MSLIVQVGSGEAASTSAPKGSSATQPQRPPPPAHLTQLTSSPHIGQHHGLPSHLAIRSSDGSLSYSRNVPLSPLRTPSHSSAGSRQRSSSGRLQNHHSLPLLTPTPAAHPLIPTNVNSPSLIPQGIPQSFLPHFSMNMQPLSGLEQTGGGSPQSTDNAILPPHAFRKLTKSVVVSNNDDDFESDASNFGRKNFISPRQRERRTFFSNVALQDHNYCAIPPFSPGRSPTPPPSPFSHLPAMGVQPSPSQEHTANDDQSFTFGLAGYRSGQGQPNLGAYPSPHYSGPQIPSQASPLARHKQSIEEAGVGPMTPLGEEGSPLSCDKWNDSRPSDEIDGGEETETAPEAEDEAADDSITRCICEYLHDDGYMICCDKCAVWQHVVCMGLDKNNIPDEYLCEKCQPRQVDKKRAKALQKAREREIFNRINYDSSDDEKRDVALVVKGKKGAIKKPEKKKNLSGDNKKPERKALKKAPKRRNQRSSESANLVKQDPVIKKQSPRKNPRRKSVSATDAETEEENGTDASALRSWIDTYEEAVTNHYSPELRARLQGAKLPNNQFKPKDVNGVRERCNVSLRGNGMKVLTANSYIPPNTPVIECRGKYMLANQLNGKGRSVDYVLFHKITEELEVCVDSKTYGNDSRFCRRADASPHEHNAEVKHHIEKGSLHLYIVSIKSIEKNQEILLPPLSRNGVIPSISIKEELKQIKKVNGILDEKKSRKNPAALKRRPKRDLSKLDLNDSSSDEETVIRPRKTRSHTTLAASAAAAEKTVNFDLKLEKKEPGESGIEKKVKLEPQSVKVEAPAPAVRIQTSEPSADKMKELKIDIKEEPITVPEKKEPCVKKEANLIEKTGGGVSGPLTSPSAPSKSPCKPVLGLPDQSGLIVGVNTINYDASLRNKGKTREEKKMEMILKAIEAMERAEARKKLENGESTQDKPATSKRRRSSSTKKESIDSNVDASSADEAKGDAKQEKPRAAKTRRRRNLDLRRRSRAKSGDSTSALSADEGSATPADCESTATPGEKPPFKYPLQKKHLNNDGMNVDSEDADDDVSGNYLRGSRSPPGIANHLLRSAVTPTVAAPKSPTKAIGCSAKKRWLRAAMSEDHSEESTLGVGSNSPGQEPGYTPLKKRRLATYNECAEETKDKKEMNEEIPSDSTTAINEKMKQLPNGLKKRLISNIIQSAVLEKAIEDVLPDDFPDAKGTDECSQAEDGASTGIGGGEANGKPAESPSRKKAKAAKKPKLGKRQDNVDAATNCSKNFMDKPTDNRKAGGSLHKKLKGVMLSPFRSRDSGVGESLSSPIKCAERGINGTLSPNGDAEQTKAQDEKQASMCGSSPSVADAAEKSVVDCDRDGVREKRAATASKMGGWSAGANEKEDKLPQPMQHSVFKSFFSTNMSIDDIDKQIEAKRVEMALESVVSQSSTAPSESLMDTSSGCLADPLTSPLPSGADLPTGTPAPPVTDSPRGQTPTPAPLAASSQTAAQQQTPQPKKKMTIADYKKRSLATRSDSVDESPTHSKNALADSLTAASTTTPNRYSGKSAPANSVSGSSSGPLPSLPELPGLETKRHHHQSSSHHKNSREGSSPKKSNHHTSSKSDSHRWDHKSRDSSGSSSARGRSASSQQHHTEPSGAKVGKLPESSSRHHAARSQEAPNSRQLAGPAHKPTHSISSPAADLPQRTVYAARAPPPPPPPPIVTPDVPREDLTERLRKEFGLTIEDSEEGEGSDDEDENFGSLAAFTKAGENEVKSAAGGADWSGRGSLKYPGYRNSYQT